MILQKHMRELRKKTGSYLVEAVLTLPICILAIVALALIIQIISICESIGFITAREVREVSLYPESFINTVSLCKKIEDGVLEECNSLTDFQATKVRYLFQSGDMDDLISITTEAHFTVDNPAGIHGEILFAENLLARGFTGTLQDASPLEAEAFTQSGSSKKVLVFLKYGEKYHLPSCTIVKREAGEKNYALEMQQEDAARKGYTACQLCIGMT